jgi:hypothetical protein
MKTINKTFGGCPWQGLKNGPMLGATDEDFSLACVSHIKTDYCINQDYHIVCR